MNSTKITFIIASIIFFVAILFLPCKNFWSGDGWVVKSISEHCSGDISKFTKDYELSFFRAPISWSLIIILGYKATSILAGLIYYLGVLMLPRKYYILLLIPPIAMFASYPELYSVSLAMMPWIFLGYLRDDLRFTLACFYLAWAANSAWAWVFLPIPVMMINRKYSLSWAAVFSLFNIAILGALVKMYQLYRVANSGSTQMFIPLTGEWGIFRWWHAREYLLFILLVLFPIVLWGRRFKFAALFASLLACLGFVLILKSDIGYLRDWDLISISFFAAAIYFVENVDFGRIKFGAIFYALITLVILAYNSSLRTDVILSYVEKDPRYTFLYPGGKSLRNISIVMHNEKGFTSEDRLRFVNIVDEKMRKEIEGE